MNERLVATRKVAGALRPTELTIEESIIKNAHLTITMVEARQQARISLDIGQDALEQVLETNLHLAKARRSIGLAHAHLATVRHDLHLPARAAGDFETDCPNPGTQNTASPLRVVHG